jgi:fatty acid desaturase
MIRPLHTLDKRWNFVILLHFALWLVTAWMAVSTNVFVLNIVCYLIGGLALSTLSVLAHESAHNLFTRHPKIDRRIGLFCGLPILFSAGAYRIVHPIHHAKLRTPEDPDDFETTAVRFKLLPLVYILTSLIGVYLYLFYMPIQGYRRGSRQQRPGILLECGVIVAMHVLAWIIFPARLMVEAWLLPLLVAGQIANIRAIAEHGLTTNGNEMTDTRTVATHPVLSFLMCNINYHIEHHLYPGVPWYNLPKLHRLLQEDYHKAGSSVYTSYFAFVWDTVKALRSGVVSEKRLIPRHLREEICL